MFNKSAIFYIGKNLVSLVASNAPFTELEIAPTLISADEVQNANAYKAALFEFISKLKINNHDITIIIDDSLVFEKSQTQEVEQSDINQFAKDLPFDLPKLAFTSVKVENKYVLLATNKQIYLGLAAALAQNKNKIEYVIPAKYFTVVKNDLQTIDFGSLHSKITKNPYLTQTKFSCTEVEIAQFATPVQSTQNTLELGKTDQKKTSVQNQENTEIKKTNPLLFVVFFVLLVVLGALLVWKFYLNK